MIKVLYENSRNRALKVSNSRHFVTRAHIYIYRKSQKKNLARVFDRRPFMCNIIFLKNSYRSWYFVSLYVLLLANFAFKLVNYSSHSEILNFQKNSRSPSFSFKNSDFTVFKHFSKTHGASKNLLLLR